MSFLYRRGKGRAYKATIDRLQDFQPFAKYGNVKESLNVEEDVIAAARLYMLSLYDRKDFDGNLDGLRAHLFDNIKGDMPLLLATSKYAFQLHLRRALHQLAL